jgi:type IV pilus assembly protein PilY1
MKSNPVRALSFRAALVSVTLLLGTAAWPVAAVTPPGTTDLASVPMANATSSKVLPNIYYILDDSGSMLWRTIPGATGETQWIPSLTGYWASSHCNGLGYNPDITYSKPASYGSTPYPDATFTAACGDGYASASCSTNLNGSIYYKYTGSEDNLKFTYDASTGDVNHDPFFNECNTSGAKISVSGTGNCSVTSVKVGSVELLSGPTVSSTGNDTLASLIAANITASGYGATASGSTVTIYTSKSTDASASPVVAKSCSPGSKTFSTTAFPTLAAGPGLGKFTAVIVTSSSSAEAQKNYANWYSYYRLRISMVKSVIGQAFADIRGKPLPYSVDPKDGDYFHARVGYTGIWNNSGTAALSLDAFEGTQKKTFYDRLYAARADNNTPTRTALQAAGQMYKTTGASAPIQYSCQRNYALLSSDGYWNSGTPTVGDTDHTADYPQKDAAGASNTMADVAYYYYSNDLRPDMADNVNKTPPKDITDTMKKLCDVVAWQHMTTLTVGLGVNGTLSFDQNYHNSTCAAPTDTSSDFYKIYNGSINWPNPGSGGDNPKAVDDLWHAAVNGRGVYFNASDPRKLKSSLKQALAFMQSASGGGAASGASSTTTLSGTIYAYTGSYAIPAWTGDLIRSVVGSDGTLSALAPKASEVMSTVIASGGYASRNIFTGSTTNQPFTPGGFTAPASVFALSQLTQYNEDWTTSQVSDYGSHWEYLVNYLRGDSTYEVATKTTPQLFRKRDSVLGDIVHSQPLYIGPPRYSYLDSGYPEWKAAHASRKPVVVVGANDGMLHGFDASTLAEKWAYVPPMVIPYLWHLADRDYATAHHFYVDGPIAEADAYINEGWHSVVVGALGKGGRGYYALQIDDSDATATPKLLWTFSADVDPNVGYTYGVPLIVKLQDGTWAAVLSSGYNNVPELAEDGKTTKYVGANGKGYVYVLKLSDGSMIRTINTDVGSSAAPSGLSAINQIKKSDTDVTEQGAYGGDLLGNMWRFDLDKGTTKPTLLMALGDKQPITTPPSFARINGLPVVMFGTGRYLGRSDTETADTQSVYAVKDDGSTTVTTSQLVNQVVDTSGTLTSYTSVDWSTKFGWYVNLPNAGERVSVAPKLVLGVFAFDSAIPPSGTSDAALCSTGGSHASYQLLYNTGGSVDGSGSGSSVGSGKVDGLPTGILVIDTRAPDGSGNVTLEHGISGGGTIQTPLKKPPAGSGPSTGRATRVQWRELLQ